MSKIKITKEHVKGVVKGLCILAYGTAAVAGAVMTRDTRNTKTYYVGATNYSDAVKVIVDSSMFDSSKKHAIELLKTDEDAGYYNAVISIINSNMFDSSKIEAIEALTRK